MMVDRKRCDIAASEDNPLNYATARRDSDVLSYLRTALEEKTALLAYQPIVASRGSQGAVFYEGLIRIPDPTGRIKPARDFVFLAEETELGRQIDCTALYLGLTELTKYSDLRLSINMSARSIGYGQWVDILGCTLRRDSSIADRLILEITERSAILVLELMMHFMRDLRQRGIIFALDDFGAGTTSFRYLRDFAFDKVKIDGQFTKNVAADLDNQFMIQSLRSISDHFGMFTIAEAVECQRDSQWLIEMLVDCQQGYFWGAPTVNPNWYQGHSGQEAATA
jgi:EAL domain-containing protein (putative c-di-GMP-specific phosphodiesterase class I)